jgi:hypothetical protein
MNARSVARFRLIKNSSGLRSGSLSRNPLADVWIAIHQCDAGRLALSEKINAFLTGQSHIREVKNDWAIFSFRFDECFQLGNTFLVDPPDQGKYHVPVRSPMDS